MAHKSVETLIKEQLNEYVNQGVVFGRKRVYKNIAYDFDRKVYYVTFDYGVDKAKGKQIKKTKSIKDVKIAIQQLQDFEANKLKQEVVAPKKTTLSDYCDYWLEYHCSNTKSTKRFYRYIIETHIKPSLLGPMKIQNITTKDINKFINYQQEREDRDLSNQTIKHHKTALSAVFNQAVNEDLILSNPVTRSKNLKIIKKPPKSFTLKEVQKIIEFSADELEPYGWFYQLAIYTGMRRGELCGLKWDNVDFDNELIFIVEAHTDEEHGQETSDVKGQLSVRAVDMIIDSKLMLLELKDRYDSNKTNFKELFHDDGFVLCYDDGTVPYPRTVTKNFKEFLIRNKIKQLPFHTLRHTFGTFQRISGASSYDIKELMGHSSITIAEKSYIAQYAKKSRPQMEKFQNYLRGKEQE